MKANVSHQAESSSIQSLILDWKSRLQAALLSSSGIQNSTISVHARMMKMSSQYISSSFYSCIRMNDLATASSILRYRSAYLYRSFLLTSPSISLLAIMNEIHAGTPLNELGSFLRRDMIPFFIQYKIPDWIDEMLIICQNMLQKIRKESAKDPFIALENAEYLHAFLAENAFHDKEAGDAVTKLYQHIKHNLQIQSECWRMWKDQVPLEDVEEFGLEGLIHDRLTSIAEDKLSNDISEVLRQTAEKFTAKLDDLLLSWIDHTIANNLIVSSADSRTASSATCSESSCTLSRLSTVVMQIKDVLIQAKSIIKMMSVSTINESVDSTILESIIFHAESKFKVEMLNKSVFDSLQELIRLYKIRKVAYSYSIVNLDPCDSKQMRYVINYIVIQNKKDSLNDAMEIISAWNIRGISVASVLTRGVCARILQSSSDDFVFDHIVNAFKVIPKQTLTCVVEDSLQCMINRLESMFSTHNVPYYLQGITRSSVESESSASFEHMKASYKSILCGIIKLLTLYLDSLRSSDVKASIYATNALLSHLRRLKALEEYQGIFLPPSLLDDNPTSNKILNDLAKSAAHEFIARKDSKTIDGRVVKICSLLQSPVSQYVHAVARVVLSLGHVDIALCFTRETFKSLYHSTTRVINDLDCGAYIDICKTLCAKQMQQSMSTSHQSFAFDINPFKITQELLSRLITGCSVRLLAESLDILSACDLVLSIMDRSNLPQKSALPTQASHSFAEKHLLLQDKENQKSDSFGNIAQEPTSFKEMDTGKSLPAENNTASFLIDQNSYRKDGILLDASTVTPLLLKHIFAELLVKKSGGVGSNLNKNPNQDDALIQLMQQSESHLLACRLLLSSWKTLNMQLFRKSNLLLTKKILAYRTIDTPLVIHCLSTLPYDSMVRELKATIPTIQSDFSRLNIVSQVGEELARLWGQDQLLIIFQGLQINAKWWAILSSNGVSIDVKAFQSSDANLRNQCIRGMVFKLLTVIPAADSYARIAEYCRQFDIEPSYAGHSYLEYLLVHHQGGGNNDEFDWIRSCHHVIENHLESSSAVNCLKKLLRSVDGYAYDKIVFVCDYLIAALTVGDIDMADDTTEEIDIYRHVIAVAKCLLAITSSGDMITKLSVWKLLDDPWSILVPLLLNIAAKMMSISLSSDHIKLTALCGILGIEKDLFHSKRIVSCFQLLLSTPSSTGAILNQNLLGQLNEEISVYVHETSNRRQLWCELADLAVSRAHDQQNNNFVVLILEYVIRQLEIMTASRSDHQEAEIQEREISYRGLLFQWKALSSYKELQSSYHLVSNHQFEIGKKILSGEAVLTVIQEIIQETAFYAWRLHHGHGQGKPATSVTLYRASSIYDLIAGQVKGEYETCFYEILHRLATQQRQTINEIISSSSLMTTTTAIKVSEVESIRYNIVRSLLADTERRAEVSVSSSMSTISFTSILHNDENLSNASAAEIRRREDFGNAFMIAFHILCCEDATKESYMHQLEAVVRGRGFKQVSMHRMSARSQLRAAIALHLLHPATISRTLLAFLISLAEIQELRLACQDETLHRIFGLETSILQDESLNVHPTGSPQYVSIIRTWIQDEGHVSGVMELSRDILLMVDLLFYEPHQEIQEHRIAVWIDLITNFHLQKHHRCLFRSYTMLHAYAPHLMDDLQIRFTSSSIDLTQTCLMIWKDLLHVVDDTLYRIQSHGGEKELPAEIVKKSQLNFSQHHPIEACNHLGISWEHSPEDLILAVHDIVSWQSIMGLYVDAASCESLLLKLLQQGAVPVSRWQVAQHSVEAALRHAIQLASTALLHTYLRSIDMSRRIKLFHACIETVHAVYRAQAVESPAMELSQMLWQMMSLWQDEGVDLLHLLDELTRALQMDVQGILQHAAMVWNHSQSNRCALISIIRWMLLDRHQKEGLQAVSFWYPRDLTTRKHLQTASMHLEACFPIQDYQLLRKMLA
jgi:hypothetical protein